MPSTVCVLQLGTALRQHSTIARLGYLGHLTRAVYTVLLQHESTNQTYTKTAGIIIVDECH